MEDLSSIVIFIKSEGVYAKKSEHAGFDTRSLFTVKSGEKSKHEYLLTIPISGAATAVGSIHHDAAQ